ncbi:TonB-dependent receptor domain-containing protein [Shigella sp. FC1967]|uniref:TonB-dependent receptor domain-containing protein n=1 Tax=Shigella sp. FC1967 TaxID=1898041 RepID=UPI000AF2F7DE|nr:TonB-dependent receptor [Shigella sp. FC1967]
MREKGNYFAGKRNAKNYSETDQDLLESVHVKDGGRNFEPYLPFIAHIYRPNNEVPNTSNRSRSLLVKGTLFPELTHRFSINYRYTDLLFGDIMPSRLSWVRYDKNLVNQWPLGNITQQAGILTYQYKSEDKQTDLLLRLWGNLTAGHTNTRGGKPREPKQVDLFSNRNTEWEFSCDTGFIDTSSLYQENNRYGIDLSSIFKLSPQFSISFSSNYQFEILDSDELELPADFDFVTSGRAGKRHEINLALSTDWKPLSWLSVTAGGKYHYYHLTDTFLNNKRRNNVKGYEKSPSIRGFILPYRRTLTAEEYLLYRAIHRIDVATLPEELKNYRYYPEVTKKVREFQQSKFVYPEYEKLPPEIKEKIINHNEVKRMQVDMMQDDFLRDEQGNLNIKSLQNRLMTTEYTVILYDKNGELSKSHNMFLSSYADINEKVPDPITGKLVNKYEMGVINPIPIYLDDDKGNFTPEPSYQHGAFSPLVSATVYANEILRFYGRYTEQLRLPNLFEDTSGFSGSKARYYGFKLKPERAKSTEFGLVFDLTDWLNVERHADIKINYFYTNIENVFDRDANWQIRQFEKQVLEGMEVQARFDNGFIFMDTALVYSPKNKVCDKNAFSHYDPFGFLGIKECMTGGLPRWFFTYLSSA